MKMDEDVNELRRALLAALPLLALADTVPTQDAARVQPRAYKVLLDNDKLRVLEFNSKPGMGVCGNGMHSLAAHTPDVVFLDIEMPAISGLEIARQIQGRCHVVFVTAYDAHAVAAFEQGAVDYVLKPFDLARLSLAVRRVEQRLGSTPPSFD